MLVTLFTITSQFSNAKSERVQYIQANRVYAIQDDLKGLVWDSNIWQRHSNISKKINMTAWDQNKKNED